MTFHVPETYSSLFDAGHFDYWGVPYASMSDDERVARHAERRSKVLWLDGIEWDPSRSPAQIAASPESDDALPGLVQFAANGGGDAFSWYLPWQGAEAAEPPVLFCPHDSTEAEYFAPDFARCLERLWLRHGAWYEGDTRDAVLTDLRGWLAILEPHLDVERVAVLRALADGADAAAFRAAEKALTASWPRAKDTLRGHNLLSTRYLTKYLGAGALRLYDESIAFYEKLVADGHARFAAQLEDTRKNREAALGELAKNAQEKAAKKAAPKKAAKAKKAAPKKTAKAKKAAPKKAAKAKKAAPKKAATAKKAAPKKAARAKKAAPKKAAPKKAARAKKAAPKKSKKR